MAWQAALMKPGMKGGAFFWRRQNSSQMKTGASWLPLTEPEPDSFSSTAGKWEKSSQNSIEEKSASGGQVGKREFKVRPRSGKVEFEGEKFNESYICKKFFYRRAASSDLSEHNMGAWLAPVL